MNVLIHSWITSSLLPGIKFAWERGLSALTPRGLSALTPLVIPPFTNLSPRKKARDICRVKASKTIEVMTNRIVAANLNS